METKRSPLKRLEDKLTQKKAGMPIWAWIVIAAIVIIAIVIVVVTFVKHQKYISLTSREQFTRLNKGNGNPMQSFVDDWISAELGTK